MSRFASPLARPLVLSLLALAACSAPKDGPDPLAAFEDALRRTNPAKAATVAPGSATEREALDRVVEFYGDFTVDAIRERVREVYAADAYFADPLKEVIGIDDIETYFVESAEAVEECVFEFHDVNGGHGEYTLRWVMKIRTKRWADEPANRVPGMTHLRFDEHGKVSFHRDYYDLTEMLWEKIPVVGGVIHSIRGGF